MINFSGKYNVLMETAIQRFQQGGFLVGDLVKIKKNALSNDELKEASAQMKERIKQLQETDVNLRLSAIKTKRANTSLGYVGGPDAPTGYYVDVVQEINPANWVNPTTLPMEVIERVEHESWQPVPIPDSLKRKSPEVTEFDNKGVAKGDLGADEYSRMSDNLNLPKKNTKLSNVEKWNDNKPGGGNTKNLLKLKKESRNMKNKDIKMLAEAYGQVKVNEDNFLKKIGSFATKALPYAATGGIGGALIRQGLNYANKYFDKKQNKQSANNQNPQDIIGSIQQQLQALGIPPEQTQGIIQQISTIHQQVASAQQQQQASAQGNPNAQQQQQASAQGDPNTQ